MPTLVRKPTTIQSTGGKPKRIEEYAGRVSSGHTEVSVARMRCPQGWVGTGQRPSFQEISVVLHGVVRVQHESGELEVRANEAVITEPSEWVRYSSPEPGGAEYVAVCLPAFSAEAANRDAEWPG
jgi:mannose-6-phosphate isomerase-like protein (cupin superfamily)